MQVVLDPLPIGLVLIAGVFAPISGWLAATRSRQPVVWFVLGALIGPFAIALLVFAPPGRCPVCDTPVPGWASACERCGQAFGRPAATGTTLIAPATPQIATRPVAVEGERTRSPGPQVGATDQPTLVPTPPSIADLGGIRLEPRLAGGAGGGAALDNAVEQVLATGLYLSGNVGLEIGATYAIARVGQRLRIFGPVDAGQLTVRHEADLDDLDVTALDDRMIISGRSGRSPIAVIFRTIGGMRAGDLEQALGAAGAGNGRTA